MRSIIISPLPIKRMDCHEKLVKASLRPDEHIEVKRLEEDRYKPGEINIVRNWSTLG
jgi:hypothetical protein